MQTIEIHTSTHYHIHIGRGLLKDAGRSIRAITSAQRAVIVTDEIVHELYAETVRVSLEQEGFAASIFCFPNGEESKSHDTLLSLYAHLAAHQLTRGDILVALGGGVVGDLTGFAAATFLRGVAFVQIPTTLLALVDSSVGGKTGVNIAAGKNLVGAFHQPSLVLCDLDTLATLPSDIFSDGMAEVVKYGMIMSPTLFRTLVTEDIHKAMEGVIASCINIKRELVEGDEFDRGDRMLLNFGHTLGHALERHYHYQGLRHGHAVAVGMCLISRLAEEYGLCTPGTSAALEDCLRRYQLPTSTDVPMNELLAACLLDKKRDKGTMRLILCEQIGKSSILTLSIADFEAFLLGRYKGGH